ncbi:hypothetical protein Tco_1522805 [Tanacetum coccineum]
MPTLRKDLLKNVKFLRWVEAKVFSSEVETEKWRRLLLRRKDWRFQPNGDILFHTGGTIKVANALSRTVAVEFVVETTLDCFGYLIFVLDRGIGAIDGLDGTERGYQGLYEVTEEEHDALLDDSKPFSTKSEKISESSFDH